MKTVAIIGGGFSGTLTAVNLARLAKDALRIVLINHGYPLGRGIAYSTKRVEHLLQRVAALGTAPAFPEQPSHFVDWLASQAEFAAVPEAALREHFVPRKVYGDYLQALLFWHGKGSTTSRARVEFIQGEALDVVPGAGRVAVVVEGHPTVETDKVLLATGNQVPADLPLPAGKFEHPRYRANPWEITADQLTDRHANVVMVGTGLTMIDLFLTLSALEWQGTIFAVSRTGLLLLRPHLKGDRKLGFPARLRSTVARPLSGLAALMDMNIAASPAAPRRKPGDRRGPAAAVHAAGLAEVHARREKRFCRQPPDKQVMARSTALPNPFMKS